MAATVLGFFLGAVWYGPFFGKAWIAEQGWSTEQFESLKKNFNPAKTYGLTFLLGLVASYVFGLFVGPKPGLAYALGASLAAGLAWVASSFASTYLWESKSLRHLLNNGGYHTLRFVLIGLAFGFLG